MAVPAMLRAKLLPYVVVGVVLWAVLPGLVSRHVVDLLIFAGLYTIAGLGVSYLLGHCGIVCLAQSMFYGIGAYCVAYFSAQHALAADQGMSAFALQS